MTDSDGPSLNAEMPAPVNGPSPNPQDPPQPIPSFVHVLPCTNPPVKYLDLLDGCATGIHVTLEDTQDLYVLCDKMANAIAAKDAQSIEGTTEPDPCKVCKAPILPSSTSPVLYTENSAHYFHPGCMHTMVSSSRTLLWPEVFPSEPARNRNFQLQKRCFGLDVAPHTVLRVNKCYVDENRFPAFDLYVKGKHLSVRKRPPSGSRQSRERPSDSSMRQPTGGHCSEQGNIKVAETSLVQVIQRLHLADQSKPFYLGDILPLEENAQFQAEYGPKPPLDDYTKRMKLLLQFRCPFVRLDGPNGEQCSQGRDCEFWHGWPKETPAFIVEQVKIRDFPRYFCVHNSRKPHTKCSELIRVHSQELVRCLTGLHPTTQDLQNTDGFAHKMAKHIMAPVVVPEQSLVCAHCNRNAQPYSVRIHMQLCVHWLHVQCFPLVRRDLNRKLELHCPSCWIPSLRTIAWPGPFPSDMAKQTIFTRQLAEFKLNTVQADTKLAIVEVANQEGVFTLDYGGTNVITINAAVAEDRTTIWYD